MPLSSTGKWDEQVCRIGEIRVLSARETPAYTPHLDSHPNASPCDADCRLRLTPHDLPGVPNVLHILFWFLEPSSVARHLSLSDAGAYQYALEGGCRLGQMGGSSFDLPNLDLLAP
jgi:hypothetical protein